ncbi:RpiB/LacA/LacB family sugar-phosphate isomerase [Actinophytocola sp.]|uniref:RpiB/LacA/LacB family sugar-phosphate isomerase n=1 Tax=Actinophytocola sp. TaxID=1872138 RepID=UPI003D6ADFBB
MRLAIVSDHNGHMLKARLIDWLRAHDHDVDDRGAFGSDVVDYPPLCADVAARVLAGDADCGVIVGGSGQGEQIASNKIRGIRAGLCHCLFTTEIARAHNKANVLVMGAKVVEPDLAEQILERWIGTPFKGGVHQRRIDQIAALERGEGLA